MYKRIPDPVFSKGEDTAVFINVNLSLGTPKSARTPNLRWLNRRKNNDLHVSLDRALWFMQLPQKLRRFHFSAEEQAGIVALLASGTVSWNGASTRRRDGIVFDGPPEPAADDPVKHYKDAQARRKLQCLTTPEGFDEALEFGFPDIEETMPDVDDETPSKERPTSFEISYERPWSGKNATWYQDTDDTEQERAVRPKTSSRALSRSPVRRKTSEMTLRLTTSPKNIIGPEKPSERDQESRSDNSKALALPELPPLTENVTGSYGPFAAHKLRKQRSEIHRHKAGTW